MVEEILQIILQKVKDVKVTVYHFDQKFNDIEQKVDHLEEKFINIES